MNHSTVFPRPGGSSRCIGFSCSLCIIQTHLIYSNVMHEVFGLTSFLLMRDKWKLLKCGRSKEPLCTIKTNLQKETTDNLGIWMIPRSRNIHSLRINSESEESKESKPWKPENYRQLSYWTTLSITNDGGRDCFRNVGILFCNVQRRGWVPERFYCTYFPQKL